MKNISPSVSSHINEITCDVKVKPHVEIVCDKTLNSLWGETFELPNDSSEGESSSDEEEHFWLKHKILDKLWSFIFFYSYSIVLAIVYYFDFPKLFTVILSQITHFQKINKEYYNSWCLGKYSW